MTQEMMAWPEWLGVPLVDNYGLEVADRRISTEMEIGSTRRVEFDTDEATVSCSLLLAPDEADFFEAFERGPLHQGSRWFKINLWLGGRMAEQTARFKGRPQITGKAGDYTFYSFTLEITQREGLMSDEQAYILLLFGPTGVQDITNRLHYILHVEAPKSTSTPKNIWAATAQDWENAQ